MKVPTRDCLMLALIAVFAAAAASGEGEAPAQPGVVVVEAVGMASLSDGVEPRQVHRQALLDARRNALQQAHVTVESSSRVRQMRLEETRVRSRMAGYVRAVSVLEAGPAELSGESVYRVRVRAEVQPLPDEVLGGVAGRSRWQPRLRMSLAYEGPEELAEEVQWGLEVALGQNGVDVLEADDSRPALRLRVRANIQEGDESISVAVRWTLDYGEQGDWTLLAPAASGYAMRTGGDGTPGVEWWESLGLGVVQEAVRLWALPRPTRMVFHGLSEQQREALRSAIDRVPRARPEPEAEPGDLGAVMLVVGDPLAVADRLLAQAGLQATMEPRELTMTRLTYAAARERGVPAAPD